MGESKIIGPDGLDIVNAGIGEKLISAEIDTNEIKLNTGKTSVPKGFSINLIKPVGFYWQDELSTPQGIIVLHRKAPSKIAPSKSAPLKLALVKLALARFTPLKFA